MILKIMNLHTYAAPSLLFGLGLIWVPAVSAQSLPDGAGKAQLQTVCTTCHGMDKVAEKGRRTPGQWRGVVALMRAYGAMGSNEDFAAILGYLNTNLSRMPTAEEAAKAAGFSRFEMGSTLTGVALYERKGYQEIERRKVPVGGEESIAVVRMVKDSSESSGENCEVS